MEKIFVDTAAWLALLNKDDALHTQARQVMKTLRQQRVAVEFINGLRQLHLLSILPASQNLWTAGWKLYSDRPDQDWSLTDCTSFAVMTQERIMQSFTSDHNFEQAGFVKLL